MTVLHIKKHKKTKKQTFGRKILTMRGGGEIIKRII
jgi:hypothetical protein